MLLRHFLLIFQIWWDIKLCISALKMFISVIFRTGLVLCWSIDLLPEFCLVYSVTLVFVWISKFCSIFWVFQDLDLTSDAYQRIQTSLEIERNFLIYLIFLSFNLGGNIHWNPHFDSWLESIKVFLIKISPITSLWRYSPKI